MSAVVNVLYFASLRETLGVSGEAVPLLPGATLAGLIESLRARGGAYADALGTNKRWRAAINHDMATLDTALKAGDEIALFPPVTGG